LEALEQCVRVRYERLVPEHLPFLVDGQVDVLRPRLRREVMHLRQLDGHRVSDHGNRDHEYDEQHQHDVDERRRVDVGHRARLLLRRRFTELWEWIHVCTPTRRARDYLRAAAPAPAAEAGRLAAAGVPPVSTRAPLTRYECISVEK